MGSSFLRKLTLIKQSGYGTYATDLGATITGIIPTGFKGDWHDMTEIQDPGESEYNGMIVPTGRSIQIGDMAEITFDGDLTFENVDYLLCCGWKNVVAGVGTTNYTRDYSTNFVGINSPVITTILAGDNSVASSNGYAISDCLLTNFDIGAARGGFTTASGTFSGHTLRTLGSYTTITPITRLAGTSIPAWMWKLYIDDVGGTMGATQKTGVLIDWSAKFDNKFHHKVFQDGVISPSTFGQGRPDVTLDMTFEQNSTALAEFVKFQTVAPRLIQLSVTLGAKSITLSFYGYYTAFDKPGDSDGNTTIKASFKCKYLTSKTNYWEAVTVNQTAALFV